MKIRPVILLILVGVLGFAVSGAFAQEAPPARPTISLDADGATAAELIYSFCWPVAAGNLQCDFELDFEPLNVLQVDPGQPITVIVAPNVTDPTSLTATVIDASGSEQVINLDPAAQAILDVELEPGVYTLEITAAYDDIAGTEAFITYRFGLEVLGEAVAGAPTVEVAVATEEAMAEVTAEATEAVEPDVTPEPAEETEEAVEATSEPTEATDEVSDVTQEPGAVATTEVEVTATLTIAPLFTDTPQVATTAEPSAAAVQPTATPTTEVAQPNVTQEVGVVPTNTATTIPQETSVATEEAGVGATNTTIPLGTTAVPTTETGTSGATSTTVPLPGAETTEPGAATLPPTTTQPPSPTTQAELPTSPTATTVEIVGQATEVAPSAPSPTSAVAQLTEPPAIEVQFAGRVYPPAGVNFCQTSEAGERVCVDRPVESATPLQLLEGAAMLVRLLDGPRPETVELAFLNTDTLAVVAETDQAGDHLLLYNVNVAPGTYFMRVTVDWGSTVANYFFPVRVN